MDLKGVALTLEPHGIVKKVWYDNLGIDAGGKEGVPFINLLTDGSRLKGLDFIQYIKQHDSSMGIQLIFKGKENHYPLWVNGVMLNDEILVLGVEENKETASFLDYLQLINNEQVNKIRELEKEKRQQTRQPQQNSEDHSLFEQVTRLNNEMATVQRQLTKKNVELERVNQLKNKFLGIAAHDLRNPLNIIQSYADLIIEEADDQLNEAHVSYLKRIMQSSEYMLGLIENLLDYSMIESGQLSLNYETFEITLFIKDIVALNNTLAERKDIQINIESSPNHLLVSADRQKIEQVVNNLLSNAIKFSQQGSKVNVRVSQRNDQLILFVKDQGIGIERDKLENIFVPFTSLHRKGTGGEKGAGLGLSITKKIIEAHGGEISVESDHGQGTTFRVLLPIKE